MVDFCFATLFGGFWSSFSLEQLRKHRYCPASPAAHLKHKLVRGLIHRFYADAATCIDLAARRQRQRPRGTASATNPNKASLRAAVAKADVMKCLSREYRSFFAPLEDEYYSSSVTFDDPLNSLSGLAPTGIMWICSRAARCLEACFQRRGDQPARRPRVGGRPITNKVDAARVFLRAAVGAHRTVYGHFCI